MLITSSGGCGGLFSLRFFWRFLLKLTFLGLLIDGIEGADGAVGVGAVMMIMQIKHDLVLQPFGPGPLLLIFL